jgi:hypothetical protein
MAAKTPTLQARSQYSRDWGNYATAADLPNASGNALANPYFTQLEVGDTAYVTGTTQQYVCTSKGTLSGADATWGANPNTDHQGPRLIVGNSVAGDTLEVCNYLDVGDGVQLQAALTAAGALGLDVWVRPGTYTISTVLTIPDFVRCYGGTWGGVIFNATATNRRIATLATYAELSNVFIGVPAPSVGAAGTEVISLAHLATMRQVEIAMSTQTAGQVANESLTSIVRTVAGDAGVYLEHVLLSGVSKRALGVAADLSGFEIQSRGAASFQRTSQLISCQVERADIGFDLEGTVSCVGWQFLGLGRAALRLGASAGSGALRMGPVVENGYAYILDIAALAQFGVIFATGSNASGLICGRVTDSTFQTTSVNAASAGASFQGTGVGNSITNCSFDGFALGIDVSATQTNATGSGYLRTFTTAVTDASGSFLNMMRNI